MSVVIVIDRCGDCPYMIWSGAFTACRKTGMEVDDETVPDWCLLNSLPEPKEINAFCDAPRSLQNVAWYNAGYNQCLDDIKGGEEKC